MQTRRLRYGNRGGFLEVARTADVPTSLLPDNLHWPMLHEALARITDEDIDESYIITCDELGWEMPCSVISNGSHTVKFGIHAGHKAREPKLSPFVDVPGDWPRTDTLVLDFSGGRLVRVMPGLEYPPLPWMSSAREDLSASTTFWQTHSYIKT